MTDASLDQIAANLEVAFNAKDAARLASLYTETATLMPPNQGAVKGRAAIEAWFKTALGRLANVQITPTRSSSLGGEAFEVGTFTTIAKGGSPAQQNSFKYVLLLKRVGAQWQIDCDIWNSDQPAGAS